MKKLFLFILSSALGMVLITGCQKSFTDLNQNENKPSSVPPYLILTNVLTNLYDAPAGEAERWDQYFLINYDYYGNNRYDFGSGSDYYPTLENVVKMEEEAKKLNLPDVNPYASLAKFFKAYFFTKMSLELGDIPMTDALKGNEDLTPAYTAQKEVFRQAFLWLDSANTELGQLIAGGTSSFSGDIYFDNDLFKWQKLVNTFRIRLLIELSKKADDPDLNIKQQFATIVGDPANYPVMESSADNLQYVFVYPTNNYPENPGSFGFNALRENTSATYVGLLTKLKDPRTFVTSEPAGALVTGGTSPTSFDAFVGADPAEDLGVMYVKANAGQYSLINRHYYYETYTGEPSIQIGYPELCFNIAEGINRGWAASAAPGGAEDYYKAGILASMASYSIPQSGTFTAWFLRSGSPGSSAVYDSYPIGVDFTAYYGQPLVKYDGNTGTGLTQILQQKYLAMFRHSGLEAYYNYRRTGVPAFTTGTGTGNSGRIALRFQYSSTEKSANAENYQQALQSQYGGNDDINGVMWLLK
jgi:hypothetical protein